MWRPQRSEIGAKASTKNQTSAVKRLLQDIKYIRENPIPTVGVVALPLEKDLFVWHCNIRGPKGTPYEGGVFHLVLNFPASYPYDPPKVTVCTTLQHPNVIGSSLCLDMLQPGDEQEKYIGWSSAYSVQSILIQLQAFLFEESPTIRVEDCRKAVETANVYTCPTCKHKPLRSWPPFPSYEQESFVLLKSERDLIREELVCFHSKRSFTEDTLGFKHSHGRCPNDFESTRPSRHPRIHA
jgi:ubiquitin-protein ligase